jgi:hypothetical protein
MKGFTKYLRQLQTQKSLTKRQIFSAVFGILLFLALALTLSQYLFGQQHMLRAQAQTAPALPLPPPIPVTTLPPSPVQL